MQKTKSTVVNKTVKKDNTTNCKHCTHFSNLSGFFVNKCFLLTYVWTVAKKLAVLRMWLVTSAKIMDTIQTLYTHTQTH